MALRGVGATAGGAVAVRACAAALTSPRCVGVDADGLVLDGGDLLLGQLHVRARFEVGDHDDSLAPVLFVFADSGSKEAHDGRLR